MISPRLRMRCMERWLGTPGLAQAGLRITLNPNLTTNRCRHCDWSVLCTLPLLFTSTLYLMQICYFLQKLIFELLPHLACEALVGLWPACSGGSGAVCLFAALSTHTPFLLDAAAAVGSFGRREAEPPTEEPLEFPLLVLENHQRRRAQSTTPQGSVS